MESILIALHAYQLHFDYAPVIKLVPRLRFLGPYSL